MADTVMEAGRVTPCFFQQERLARMLLRVTCLFCWQSKTHLSAFLL